MKQHDHVILADTGEVLEFCDPRIQQIKATLEELFDIEVMHHSLNIYARKRAQPTRLLRLPQPLRRMKVDVLLGLQWGDEGKGKIVDVLTPEYDVIARFQGPNAGHTLEFDGIKHVLHTIPSGVFRPDTLNVVGNGVVIDPIIFKKEIDALVALGVDVAASLAISRKATSFCRPPSARCGLGSREGRPKSAAPSRHWSHLHGQDRA